MKENNVEVVNVVDIARNLAELHNITKLVANTIVQSVFDEIGDAVQSGKRVSIARFGIFEPVTKPEHSAHNPRTREIVRVAEKRTIKFKPSSVLKGKVAGN
jgi:nucleoid DNA-binding protein